MAEFPVVNFAQYQWEVNDQNYLTKWNNFQTAITALQNSINAFGGEVEQELTDTITAVETIRDEEVIPAKNAAQQSATNSAESAAEALQYRNEAQQIAVGDVAITDLQPGTLDTEKDYVSVDAQGALVRRNLAADVSAQLTAGNESAKLSRYDLASVSITATLDLATSNVFRVDASVARTLAFANAPGANRAMTVVVHISGNSAVTWPAGIVWDSDAAPELGAMETKVVLFWDGEEWSGFVRVAK